MFKVIDYVWNHHGRLVQYLLMRQIDPIPNILNHFYRYVILVHKRKWCGTCIGCLRKDCGKRVFSQDMRKFGGEGKKKCCVRRICTNLSGTQSHDQWQKYCNTSWLFCFQGQCKCPKPHCWCTNFSRLAYIHNYIHTYFKYTCTNRVIATVIIPLGIPPTQSTVCASPWFNYRKHPSTIVI